MATIEHYGDWTTGSVFRVTVPNMAGDDVSSPVDGGALADRSVQVYGTFATGSIVIEGRNSTATSWGGLTDPQGNALIFTDSGLEQIQENVHQLRARATTTGTASDADVTVVFLMRGE